MRELDGRHALVLLALVVGSFVAFWELGSAPLEDWDEGHHAKVALDMMRADEWLVYGVDGALETANRKPPLLFYALIGAFRVAGPTEYAARAGSAACFVGLLGVTTWFVQRVLSPSAAVATLVLMATSRPLLFDHFARDGVVDCPLALALSVTMYALWLGKGPTRVSLVAFAVALLAKGVAAFQIVPPAALWLVTVGKPRRALGLAGMVALSAVPLALWLVVREQAAPGFVWGMLTLDVAGRVGHMIGESNAGSPLYFGYVAHHFARIAAVVALAIVASRGGLDLGRTAATRTDTRSLLVFLAAWCVLPIAMFSFAATKHEWYVLPSWVPADILAGWVMSAGFAAWSMGMPARWRPIAAGVALAALTAFVGGKTLSRLVRHHPVEARAGQMELASLLAGLTDAGQPCEVALYRADQMPAARFYLTRAGVPYRVLDDTLEVDLGGRRWCVVAARTSVEPLLRWQSSFRPTDDFPRLGLAVVHTTTP